MAAKYNIGVVGAGAAFQMALPALRAIGRIAIHHLDSGAPAGSEEFDYYSNVSEMLKPDVVRFAYIATPVSTHHSLAILAASRGIPTLLEKPMFMSLAEAQSIPNGIRKFIFPAFRKRYSSPAQAIRRIHSAGRNDEATVEYTWLAPYPGDTHWKICKAISGGGVTMDIVCHMLDLIENCVGPISSIETENVLMHSTQNTDSYLEVSGTISGRSRYRIRAGWAAGESVQLLRFRNSIGEVLWTKRGSDPDSSLTVIEGTASLFRECHRSEEYSPMFADFLAADKNRDGPLPRFSDGLRNLELISTIHKSIY
jgi:predicted dehydrogenase